MGLNITRLGGNYRTLDITPVRSPVRAKRDIFGTILDVFWPIQAAFVLGEPLCDVGIPS